MAKYDIHEEKSYAHGVTAVYQAAQGAAAGLEGQLLKEDNSAGTMTVKFDKKIHGKVLGDRTEMQVAVRAGENGGSTVAVEAYPIDAVGRKLMFGARKGVTRTVLDWYWAHLEHRLP